MSARLSSLSLFGIAAAAWHAFAAPVVYAEPSPAKRKYPRHIVFVVHGVGDQIADGGLQSKILGMEQSLKQVAREQYPGHDLPVLDFKDPPQSSSVPDAFRRDPDIGQMSPAPEGDTTGATGQIDVVSTSTRSENRPPDMRLVAIEWHSIFHANTALEERVKRVQPPAANMYRTLINEKAMDLLCYMTPQLRGDIQSTVVNLLNSEYKKFCDEAPGEPVEVSIVGHSLGSVIVWSILDAQVDSRRRHLTDTAAAKLKLNFDIKHFFSMGSPVGLFLTLESFIRADNKSKPVYTPTNSHQIFPHCERFYNIFHHSDPVAHLVGPCLEPTTPHEPSVMEHYKSTTNTRQRIADTVGRTLKPPQYFASRIVKIPFIARRLPKLPEQREPEAPPAIKPLHPTDEEFGTPACVDFELQINSLQSSINEYLFSAGMHYVYWYDRSVILFMLRRWYGVCGD